MNNHIACPFCKTRNTRFAKHDTLGFAVVCNKCGARTDWFASKAAASRAWNKAKQPNDIYVITVCTELKTKHGWPHFGSTRTVGFYMNENDAVDTIFNNNGDIYEYAYHYAILEKINEGVYGTDSNYKSRIFKVNYVNNDDIVVEEIKDKPSWMNSVFGIGMG